MKIRLKISTTIQVGYFRPYRFKNQSSFGLRYINRTEYIPYDFDPTGVDELNKIDGEKTYYSEFFEAQYSSDPRKISYMNYLEKQVLISLEVE